MTDMIGLAVGSQMIAWMIVLALDMVRHKAW
jgi:hypothetical protein